MENRVLDAWHDMSSDDLIAATIADFERAGDDEEPSPKHLAVLHQRPTRHVFEQACELAASTNPVRQVVGIRILSELGPAPRLVQGLRSFSEESVPVLEAVVAGPASTDALMWAISALGNNGSRSSLDLVLGFTCHEDPDIRRFVSSSISSLVDLESIPDSVVAAYEQLILDPSPDVRWDALWEVVENLEISGRVSLETFQSVLALPAGQGDDESLQEKIETLARHGLEERSGSNGGGFS